MPLTCSPPAAPPLDPARPDAVTIVTTTVLTLARTASQTPGYLEHAALTQAVTGARTALRALTVRRYAAVHTARGGYAVLDRWNHNRAIPGGSGLDRRDARELAAAQNGLNADEIDDELCRWLADNDDVHLDWPRVTCPR